MLKPLVRQPVNLTSAGLRCPLTALPAGAQLLKVLPLLHLTANVSLGVGALSRGAVQHHGVADTDAYPDLDVFAARRVCPISAPNLTDSCGQPRTTLKVKHPAPSPRGVMTIALLRGRARMGRLVTNPTSK